MQSIGNFNPGQSININISKQQPIQSNNNYQGSYQNDLYTSMRTYVDSITRGDGSPILIARRSNQGSFDVAGSSADHQCEKIYIFRLDYSVSGSFEISSDMIKVRIERQEKSEQDYNYGTQTEIQKGLYQQRVDAGGWFVTSYHINLPSNTTVQALCPKLTGRMIRPSRVSMYNNITGKWDQVNPDGSSIANPNPYISPNNDVRIMIYVPQGNGTLVGAVKLTAIGNQR